ncbi:MAG TPA: L-lactate dehydrogenase [Edaphobacter sp.]|jgi:L-lactate dehydrogenase|nr:L-lactate dehydrogenase [Edaphobacter sp.]
MPSTHTRIAIIGCGHVGTSCAYAILQNRLAREIVLIGDTENHVQGEALDLQQAVPLGSPIKIFAGTYKDAAACSIVILTVGIPGKFQGSRLDMLAGNVVIVRSCVTKLLAEGFDGVIVIATNPVDVLTYIVQKESGLPQGKVIGSGTLLDTERLRNIIGEQLEIDPRSVHAAIIGEHGDSSVAVWSSAQVAGIPLTQYPGASALPTHDELLIAVRYAGPAVALLKGNTCFAIASCVTRICEAILRDERSVLVVSTLVTGQYGLHNVALSTPCIVGSGGIESVIELKLNKAEQKALEASAAILRNAYDKLLPAGATNANPQC